MFARYR
jgi:hypothetical protein